MYYLFKNKKVDKINEDIIKVNKINEDEIIKVDEINDDEIIKAEEIKAEEIIKVKSDAVVMPSLPIRVRKPIRKNQLKTFSLSIFSYKIIDASVNNTLTLGIGVGLGIGLSIGVCLGALLSFSVTSSK